MNEFIEQFVLESRENIEQGTADLLALEKTPADKGRLDSAFRAFHTLKGGAGIVDFNAMAHAVHAAEDVLAGVRSGKRVINAQLIGDCLTCLDQVVQWIEVIESTGELPPRAQAEAEVVAARFAASAGAAVEVAPAPVDWAGSLTAKHTSPREKAATAVRYTPESGCFYEGADPLARIAALPGLLAVELNPLTPWPPLDALDPFACNLVITALTQSSRSDVTAALGDALEQCEVLALGDEAPASGADRLSPAARELLAAQILLMDEPAAQGAAGRMGSAGMVAVSVLRHAGEAAAAAQVARALEASLSAHEPRVLREAIESAYRGAQTAAGAEPAAAAEDQESKARTLRIPAARIDTLVNLTGELTVAKNSIGHAAALAQEAGGALAPILKTRHAVLDRLVGELQRLVLEMRVLPLRQVFQRFPRLVREIAGDLGKPASLVIEGGETEADKAIVEMLFEPLLHVLRNAIDHGVEDAATRAAARKPAVATIRLRAGRQAEHVVVEVSDDGGGIDVARIREVAHERGVAPEEILAAMSDEEAIDLIFAPGFSTARAVTGLSGRGVGMDAVRTAVHRLAGRVNIESRPGQGTTVRFILPFSVMMTRVMVVGAGAQKFGIPLDAVVETLRIGTDKISPLGSMHAVVLRNRTIPLITLDSALGLTATSRHEVEATLVITNIDGHYGALRVDRIGERMEVMLKPLDGLLAGMRGLAGSTLLGDGSVLLILDLAELFQ